ncbi:MAG: hypothetical protein GWP91_24605 [Rhodobacterales bacterium]|nr:hypothetical protein [Rhodobacterales bacterium]
MRSISFGLLGLSLLAGCAGKYKPESAVVSGWDRTRTFAVEQASTVQYTGAARTAAPVIPFMAFGAAFDLDLVVKTKSDTWDMYEWARLSTAEGPLWIALQSRTGTLDQVLIADVPEIDAWMPELPMQRMSTPMKVVDRSTNDELDITLQYENTDHEEVEVSVQGQPPHRYQKKRNGNTLGHGDNQAMSLVDIPHRESLFKAKVMVNGQSERVVKVAGFVPFQFALEQVQGGLATASFYTVPSEDPRPLEAAWALPLVHVPMAEAEAEPEPEPEVVVEENPMVVQMDAGLEDLQGCYTKSAEVNADIEGNVMLSWTVTEGAASAFTVVVDTVGDEAFATCLTDILGGWTWEESIDGEVGFPINVVKGEGVVLHPKAAEDDAAAEAGDDLEEAAEAGDDLEEAAEAGDDLEDAAEEMEEGAEAEEDLAATDDLLGADEDAAPAASAAAVYNGIADFNSFHRMTSGNEVELEWQVDHQGSRVVVSQVSPFRTLRYEYLVHYDSLELVDVTVNQYGRGVAVMHMDISPALPDLRKPFNGTAESQYVIDVNGQAGYATGVIQASWSDGGPRVKVIPSDPDWTEAGDLVTQVVFRDGQAEVRTSRQGR